MTSITNIRIRGGTLPAVMIVSGLMLLMVVMLIGLWETDMQLFSRSNFLRRQRFDMESAFTLYAAHPEIMHSDTLTLSLYSDSQSEVYISKKQWGLYEAVTVATTKGRLHQSRIFGLEQPSAQEQIFYYKDNGSALTLSGRTDMKGKIGVPRNGLRYGQKQSDFFSGEIINSADISVSEPELPAVSENVLDYVDNLRNRVDSVSTFTNDLCVPFYRTETARFDLGSGEVSYCCLSGNVVIYGGDLTFDASCALSNVLVVAETVVLHKNFTGTLQLFADSVIVESGAKLLSPSGIWVDKYCELSERIEINGYVVVRSTDQNIKHPNYRQVRTAVVRGLLYIDGVAALHGITTGVAMIDRAVHYSPQGYYRDMLFDVTVLPNDVTPYPILLDGTLPRKEAACVE